MVFSVPHVSGWPLYRLRCLETHQALIMSVTVWLAKWSRQSEEEQQRGRYLLVLVLLTVAAVVVSLLRALVTFINLVRVRGVYLPAMYERDMTFVFCFEFGSARTAIVVEKSFWY